MDFIKAATSAVGGVLSDQWKEFIYCDEMTPETIIVKGRKRTSSQGRSSNTTAEDNIISNGSVIAVNAGQCAIIVESGKVAELCAEPGEFVYDKSTEPSVFSGSLGESIIGTFRQIGRRFTFGGDPGKDQRVYYFNMKELIGNKYGTPSLIPFPTILDLGGVQRRLMVRIKCFGEYSYRVVNPILFYTNVAGNVADEYLRSEIDGQLKTELLTALQPAFAKIGAAKISYDELPAHTMELADALNNALSAKWRDPARHRDRLLRCEQCARGRGGRKAHHGRAERDVLHRPEPCRRAARRRAVRGDGHGGGQRGRDGRGDGIHGHGHGKSSRQHERDESLCDGTAAGGAAGAGAAAARRRHRRGGRELGVRMRHDEYREVLYGLRQAETGGRGGGRMDVRMRPYEPREFLLGVRCEAPRGRTVLSLRQMRLAAGRPRASAEVLSGVRGCV